MSSLPPEEWDLEEALVDAISYCDVRDGAEEILRDVLTDPKYRQDILKVLGLPDGTYVWAQDHQVWFCDAYDHGPFCRSCRRVDL